MKSVKDSRESYRSNFTIFFLKFTNFSFKKSILIIIYKMKKSLK